jgi:hypothetical protein
LFNPEQQTTVPLGKQQGAVAYRPFMAVPSDSRCGSTNAETESVVMAILFDGAVTSPVEMTVLQGGAINSVWKTAQTRGIASREEAEFLFQMDRSGYVGGPEWFELAVRSVADFVVWDLRPTGHVTEADADWLLGLVGDQPTAFGRAVLFAIVRNADDTPRRLSEMVIRAGVSRSLLV